MAAPDSLHRHAFWIYGVIVGLAIERALVDLLPHLFHTPVPGQPPVGFGHGLHDSTRLFLFLIVITRFYLGAALFFEEAHCAADCDTKFPKRNYPIDFLFGFFHFLIFFVWAISINPHEMPVRLFPVLLSVILLYDLFWYFACRQYDTRHLMKLWTALNLLTFVVALVAYLVTRAVGGSLLLAQGIAFIPVFLASAIDLMELVTGRPMFKKWLSDLVRMPGSSAA